MNLLYYIAFGIILVDVIFLVIWQVRKPHEKDTKQD